MKFIDKLIRVLLVGMILLSLYLSAKIWTNSGSKDVSQGNQGTESTVTLKQAKDVFLPVKLIYHNEEGKHLFTNKENLIVNVNKELIKLEIGSLSQYSDKDKNKFFEKQLKRNSLELFFSDPLPLNYFYEINGSEPKKGPNQDMLFERMVLSFDDNKLYLMTDNDYQIYETTYKGSLSTIKELLRDDNNRFLEVLHQDTELPIFYHFKEDLKLKKYSYILATQSYTAFSQAFFDNSQEIFPNDDNKESRDINLMNAEGSSLNVSYNTGEINFNGRYNPRKNHDTDRTETATIYDGSFYYIEKIANSMGTLRYFERSKNQVVYRNYVEGYPIFSDHSRGRVEVTKQNQNVQIATNQETIQVPIPSDEEVILPSTEKVIADLKAQGVSLEDMESLQIGYTWETNQETKQVVDLVPEWYIKYQGEWTTITDLQPETNRQGGEN
ncbi:YycH family regulatory protein [Vagococcus salmoninarum]|uniref:Regulatory protein YycH domain-containing protein n=1 Tax=Vagococcus salmoninarum TaxID=2739 RepID=A0A429ZQ34_9ENTE|nr:two-component system activity regulator YycH [Vagococcus salmoninarum]RST95791.1 hypothetical protein CBF35_07460 [Vagococcus salmoninarum]